MSTNVTDDYVVAAWAEGARGPGWANQPIWYVVRKPSGEYRLECIQPSMQSPEMVILYGVSQAAHAAMTAAVRKWGYW